MGLTLVLITLCGGVVFLLLPSELAFAAPPESALGPWRGMFRLADQANLRFNLCPSLHVAWGIICVDIYAQAAGRPGWLVPTLLWSWGIGILLSTLLLHQHHLVDAVGGAALALLGSRVLYPRFLHRFQRGEV